LDLEDLIKKEWKKNINAKYWSEEGDLKRKECLLNQMMMNPNMY
jgi:hypothetical protein